MSNVGYARVSSVGQSLDVQLEQLAAAGCEKVFAEKRTGTSTDGRDQLADALDYAREGDVFIVCRLDRLARSIIDLRKIIDQLTAKGVGFRCLQQGAIDTTRSDGRLLLNILASFAEFETDIRKERQAEGIAKAKDEGKYKGRPATVDPAAIAELEAQGLGASAIAKKLGISRASVYRVRNDGVRPVEPTRMRSGEPIALRDIGKRSVTGHDGV
jgi:DNA invertase Pin-like site-specific DNA recombinase